MAKATMLVETTEGFRDANTKAIESSDAKAILTHLKRGGLTMGFSIFYAVHPTRKIVMEFFRKGPPTLRLLNTLVGVGFEEFHFSWAFAGKKWRFEDGTEVETIHLDLTTVGDIEPWARAFGVAR